MPIFLCETCGTSYPEAAQPPARCVICEEERQFVPRQGQVWLTVEELLLKHVNGWRQLEPNLLEIHTWPQIGIGQRAMLVRTPQGNLLWDCLALIDDATKTLIDSLGGLRAVAISHPHYYTRMQDWAAAFDVPVHIHADDRQWVMRDSPALHFWQGDRLDLWDGLTVLRLGGHFEGAAVLHWPQGAEGRGVLLSGDTIQVVHDTNKVTFLWSYPNMMPLSAGTVRRIAAAVEPWPFERVYGAFVGLEVRHRAKEVVARSADRYIELLETDK